ncbi:MAG: FAD synthase [Candidatus Kerfeldbacteria bacterium CG08_land_8_20_14_0_20_40_16]|uniref:FAD synthase n=1 Tax=Candidatus Kerfeldbacteria bacterium CG08_land_8_20_14_0_20_40_16 TaxID=2014244 RepID=A0A2H0YX66_9BACT|nr:MAG: FAD synthase [Candidatus Kerfeldbacteria bacterium CG08_land_8_20_14_0_20_40_16]
MKKVLAFGTFDILHPGHKSYLKQAKALGDFLVVAIARDKNIQKTKGALPQNSERQRLKRIKELKIVDRALLGFLDDPYQIIERVKPDAIALGYDQATYTENLEQKLKNRNLNCQIVRLKPHHPEKYKSSILKKDKKTGE